MPVKSKKHSNFVVEADDPLRSKVDDRTKYFAVERVKEQARQMLQGAEAELTGPNRTIRLQRVIDTMLERHSDHLTPGQIDAIVYRTADEMVRDSESGAATAAAPAAAPVSTTNQGGWRGGLSSALGTLNQLTTRDGSSPWGSSIGGFQRRLAPKRENTIKPFNQFFSENVKAEELFTTAVKALAELQTHLAHDDPSEQEEMHYDVPTPFKYNQGSSFSDALGSFLNR